VKGSSRDQIHPKGDSIRRHSLQIDLNLGQIESNDMGAQAAMDGNGRRWSCLRERIYFISTNLGSDDDGDEDAEGDLSNGNEDDDGYLRAKLPTRDYRQGFFIGRKSPIFPKFPFYPRGPIKFDIS
jgi:hypothetical protein